MPLGDPTMPMPVATCPRHAAHVAAVGGRVLATIRGALGTAVLAGRDGVVVCSSSLVAEETGPAGTVWTYDRVVGMSAEWTGTLSILGLAIRGRPGTLPLIALDRDGVSAALVAIDRVQHLIDLARDARQAADRAASIGPTTAFSLATAAGGR
jgi:hypothetical protein